MLYNYELTNYYDYYKEAYFNDKNELFDSVNEYSDKDIEFTYSSGWDICTSQGYSCPLIPVYAKNHTIFDLALKNETDRETTRYLNKKIQSPYSVYKLINLYN